MGHSIPNQPGPEPPPLDFSHLTNTESTHENRIPVKIWVKMVKRFSRYAILNILDMLRIRVTIHVLILA